MDKEVLKRFIEAMKCKTGSPYRAIEESLVEAMPGIYKRDASTGQIIHKDGEPAIQKFIEMTGDDSIFNRGWTKPDQFVTHFESLL